MRSTIVDETDCCQAENQEEIFSRLSPAGDSAAKIADLYFCGADGVAGAGCVFTGCDLIPCNTEAGLVCRLAYTESVIDVSMNATADQVVALERALAAPRGPNAVWLPWPPKAAEMSPLLPLCRSTTMMMKKQTRM